MSQFVMRETQRRSVSSMAVSEACPVHGAERKRCCSLGVLRLDFSSNRASCAEIVDDLPSAVANSEHRPERAASSAKPHSKGAPNNIESSGDTRPKLLTDKPDEILDWLIISHLELFKFNPIALPEVKTTFTSLSTSDMEPTSVMSSRYPSLVYLITN